MPRKRLFSYHSPGWDDEAEPEAEVAEGTPREQAKAELLGSLQRLWQSKQYADLVIKCQKEEFDVHKTIVCPRSSFLAEACRAANSENQQPLTIVMNDEEPKALGICLEYYYSLDYATSVIEEETPEEAAPVAAPDDEDTAILAPPPREPAEWIPAKVDEAPSFGGQRPLTPESLRDDAKAEPLEEEHAPTAALDESSPLSPAKKKNKKKKKKASQAVSGDSEAASAEPDGAAAVEQNPKPEPVQDSEPAQAEPEPAPVNYTTLSLHAAIYNLSKKLGTPSLSSLSLAKFRQAAGEKKGAPEFLQVTRDIYTAKSITPSGEEDRSLKDVIVDTLFEDQSLLDRKETQDAIKDLSLGFDLIMKMRRHLAAVDTWR